jgi:hypothetical protein
MQRRLQLWQLSLLLVLLVLQMLQWMHSSSRVLQLVATKSRRRQLQLHQRQQRLMPQLPAMLVLLLQPQQQRLRTAPSAVKGSSLRQHQWVRRLQGKQAGCSRASSAVRACPPQGNALLVLQWQ